MAIRPCNPRCAPAALALLLLALLLSACGGVQPADPQLRVRSFFTDFAGAVNDPRLADPERQQHWAARLASHIKPGERAQARADFKQAFGPIISLGTLAGPGADVRLALTIEELETALQSQSAGHARVALVGGTIKLSLTGADVQKLAVPAEQLTQEVTIEEFARQVLAGQPDNSLALEQIDGSWYLTLVQR